MAIDNRDWYKNLLRKRTGYVERAAFRLPVSEAEGKKPFVLNAVWRVLIGFFVVLLVIGLLSKL